MAMELHTAALVEDSQASLEQVPSEIAPTAALRVLNIPELLEHILTYLSLAGINNARQVSRLFQTVIDTSKPLRRPMFRVLGSAKLLEHILTRGLMMTEVTRARQVCRFFQTVIDGSKSLRQAMFLEPEPGMEDVIVDTPENTPSYLSEPAEKDLPSRKSTLTAVKIHPSIERGLTWFIKNDPESFALDFWARSVSWESKARCWSASWRSMYVCQPPCNTFYAYLRCSTPFTRVYRTVHGNTLGAPMDVYAELPPGMELYGLRLPGCIDETYLHIIEYRRKVAEARAAQQLAQAARDAERQRSVDAQKERKRAKVQRRFDKVEARNRQLETSMPDRTRPNAKE